MFLVEFEDDKRIKLYEKILDPKNNVELQIQSELKLSVKMLFDELDRKYRQNIKMLESSMGTYWFT